ncbi:MAG: SRPBCC family protein [Flavobacteriales bacterium]
MKVLRIILVLVALLAILIVGIGFMGPTGMEISHSKTIKAPKEAVYNQVNNLKNWKNWSPWYAEDPEMKLAYSEGDASGEGAWYTWNGEKSGVGKLEIREASDSKLGMDIGFDLGKGLEYSTCDMMFKELGEAETEVTWTFSSSNQTGFISRIMNVVMPSMLKGQYEKGLNGLESAAQDNPFKKTEPKKVETGMRIQEMDGFHYIGKRFNNIMVQDIKAEDYANSYGKIMEYLGGMNAMNKLVQPPIALTESYNLETTESTFVVAMKTSELIAPNEDLITDYFKAHKAMTIVHLGPYENLPGTYEKIMGAIRAQNMEPIFPSYEVYITDPGAEPDQSKWETLVVVPIQWTE